MKNVEKALNEIINICHDGAEGYNHAATHLDNEKLTTIFHRLSQQRKLFAEEIKNEALKLGMDIDDSGTMKGYFHRLWMDVSAVFNSDDEKIINESLIGESKAVEVYKKALFNEDIPKYIHDMLDRQITLIEGSVNQLKSLHAELEMA